MIKLSPDQYKQLATALGEAFDLEGLARLLRFKLGRDLTMEAGGKDGEEIIFSLITKAQRNRWLPDLIEAALKTNPTPELEQIAGELRPALIEAARDHYNVTFVDNNRALINRTKLRDSLRKLASSNPTDGRILLVNGPRLSGKTYTIELISYLYRALRNFRFVGIDLKELSSGGEVTPEHIANEMVGQMSLDPKIVPDLNEEQDSRWVQSFCTRLQGVLANAETPWWIVIDGFTHARLSTPINDMVKELSRRIRLYLPDVRMILISYPDDQVPELRQVAMREDTSPITERDLINFFKQIYEEKNKQFSPRDIAERIGEVMQRADPTTDNYMETLGVVVVEVANQISA